MENRITESQAKIQRVLVGLGIESSMAVVDEWRTVLRERGKCGSLEEAVKLLRECIDRADVAKEPIQRPSQAGRWIGLILQERAEKQAKAARPPATDQQISEYQERDMRDPVRIARFQASWDELIRLEKENGTFEDEFHTGRRKFMGNDLVIGRIRDLYERYVAVRTSVLKRQIEVRERAEALQKTSQDAQPDARSEKLGPTHTNPAQDEKKG
jgi:hypothetical protein